MKLHVSVTEEHIAQGIRYQCEQCPVALALIDSGATFPEAGARAITCDIGGSRQLFMFVPTPVRQFMRDFDSGLDVKPFSFDLEN